MGMVIFIFTTEIIYLLGMVIGNDDNMGYYVSNINWECWEYIILP